MAPPQNPAALLQSAGSYTSEDELMDIAGLALGMALREVAASSAVAELRLRRFLEEATEQDWAREHGLAVRSIVAALDRDLIGKVADLIQAGNIHSVADLVAGAGAVN
ncbi:hypothetical protein [Sphingobium ummariense]|uniref:Uncharacterized protein n=1 Tax=Sphingobium ummariense RL-3 TaxID=1346791 RepID=T0J0M5_9SPHN|nr:hypothetical protein [Sphingobium ummariense]EQB31516.1 hypothetical protein M529_14455 [Sphingobium ummariense RL-3]